MKTLIIKRYPNSLGKFYDPADIVIRLNNNFLSSISSSSGSFSSLDSVNTLPEITSKFSPDDRVFDILNKTFETGEMSSSHAFVIDISPDKYNEPTPTVGTSPVSATPNGSSLGSQQQRFVFPHQSDRSESVSLPSNRPAEIASDHTRSKSHSIVFNTNQSLTASSSSLSSSPLSASHVKSSSPPSSSSSYLTPLFDDPLTAVAVVNQQQIQENQKLQDRLQNGVSQQQGNSSQRNNSLNSTNSFTAATNTTPIKPAFGDDVKRIVENSFSQAAETNHTSLDTQNATQGGAPVYQTKRTSFSFPPKTDGNEPTISTPTSDVSGNTTQLGLGVSLPSPASKPTFSRSDPDNCSAIQPLGDENNKHMSKPTHRQNNSSTSNTNVSIVSNVLSPNLENGISPDLKSASSISSFSQQLQPSLLANTAPTLDTSSTPSLHNSDIQFDSPSSLNQSPLTADAKAPSATTACINPVDNAPTVSSFDSNPANPPDVQSSNFEDMNRFNVYHNNNNTYPILVPRNKKGGVILLPNKSRNVNHRNDKVLVNKTFLSSTGSQTANENTSQNQAPESFLSDPSNPSQHAEKVKDIKGAATGLSQDGSSPVLAPSVSNKPISLSKPHFKIPPTRQQSPHTNHKTSSSKEEGPSRFKPSKNKQNERQKGQDMVIRQNLLASKLLSSYTAVVPQVDVLIVEDNIINMKILERYLRQRSIRSDWAENGRKAIEKWRQGGFHLVLMDIQMPELSGLEATKEIRRLEQVNRIGVFSTDEASSSSTASSASSSSASLSVLSSEGSTPNSNGNNENGNAGNNQSDNSKNTNTNTNTTTNNNNNNGNKNTIAPEDVLDTKVFKFPVIIVALTASSALADKTEALAAGCNDYLVKPVNLKWLWRKTIEWGCMQALIDFEGWKHWVSKAPPSIAAAGSSSINGGSRSLSSAAKVAGTGAGKPLSVEGAGGNVADGKPALAKESHIPRSKSVLSSSLNTNKNINSDKDSDVKERPPPISIVKSNHRDLASLQPSPSKVNLSSAASGTLSSNTFDPASAGSNDAKLLTSQKPSSTPIHLETASGTAPYHLLPRNTIGSEHSKDDSVPAGLPGSNLSSLSTKPRRSNSFTRKKTNEKPNTASFSRLSKLIEDTQPRPNHVSSSSLSRPNASSPHAASLPSYIPTPQRNFRRSASSTQVSTTKSFLTVDSKKPSSLSTSSPSSSSFLKSSRANASLGLPKPVSLLSPANTQPAQNAGGVVENGTSEAASSPVSTGTGPSHLPQPSPILRPRSSTASLGKGFIAGKDNA